MEDTLAVLTQFHVVDLLAAVHMLLVESYKS